MGLDLAGPFQAPRREGAGSMCEDIRSTAGHHAGQPHILVCWVAPTSACHPRVIISRAPPFHLQSIPIWVPRCARAPPQGGLWGDTPRALRSALPASDPKSAPRKSPSLRSGRISEEAQRPERCHVAATPRDGLHGTTQSSWKERQGSPTPAGLTSPSSFRWAPRTLLQSSSQEP